MNDVLDGIRSIALGNGSRARRAQQIAAVIKAGSLGKYRWVGIYDVGPISVSIVAWSGPGAPAYPTFPVAQGLTSAAISQRSPVLVNDVSVDSRYLTAFGSTLSEIIIPILDEKTGAVVGTIDVESEQANAFSGEDQKMLEDCADAARPLWVRH
jgi:putative methionine-R-sulfoxide reductase with GAF domain